MSNYSQTLFLAKYICRAITELFILLVLSIYNTKFSTRLPVCTVFVFSAKKSIIKKSTSKFVSSKQSRSSNFIISLLVENFQFIINFNNTDRAVIIKANRILKKDVETFSQSCINSTIKVFIVYPLQRCCYFIPNTIFKKTSGNMLVLVSYITGMLAFVLYIFCQSKTCIYWFGSVYIIFIFEQNKIQCYINCNWNC